MKPHTKCNNSLPPPLPSLIFICVVSIEDMLTVSSGMVILSTLQPEIVGLGDRPLWWPWMLFTSPPHKFSSKQVRQASCFTLVSTEIKASLKLILDKVILLAITVLCSLTFVPNCLWAFQG